MTETISPPTDEDINRYTAEADADVKAIIADAKAHGVKSSEGLLRVALVTVLAEMRATFHSAAHKRSLISSVRDAGVFCQSREYHRGDGVSFAGSWWISQTDHNKEKPGTGKFWRLAVKRGRDGKDAQ